MTACNREVFFVQSACADLLAGVVVGSEQRCAKICFKLPKTRLIVKFTIAVSGWASWQQKHAINCTKSRSELHPKSRGWLSGASNVARKSALIWLSGTPHVVRKNANLIVENSPRCQKAASWRDMQSYFSNFSSPTKSIISPRIFPAASDFL